MNHKRDSLLPLVLCAVAAISCSSEPRSAEDACQESIRERNKDDRGTWVRFHTTGPNERYEPSATRQRIIGRAEVVDPLGFTVPFLFECDMSRNEGRWRLDSLRQY